MNSSLAAMDLAKSRQKSKQDLKEKNRLYDQPLSGSFGGGMSASMGSQHSLRGNSLNSSFHSSISHQNKGGSQQPHQRGSSSSKELDFHLQNQKTPSRSSNQSLPRARQHRCQRCKKHKYMNNSNINHNTEAAFRMKQTHSCAFRGSLNLKTF